MKIFVERPIATSMFFLAFLVLGIYSFLNVPVELAPQEEYPQINIITDWHGVPPEIIQTQVTSPLEEVASMIKGVRKITSTSRIGSSLITLDFDAKTNMQFAELSLREVIARARGELPPGREPRIQLFIPEEFRVKHFLNYTISANYPIQKLRAMIKDKLEYAIRSVKGVAGVEVTGGSDPVTKIIIDKKKTKALDVHSYQIFNALGQRSLAFQAGRVKKGTQEYIFKIVSSIKDIKDLGEIIVAHSADNSLKLKKIAQIIPSYDEIPRINRINGKFTVMLRIIKEKGTNTLKVAKKVKEKLELVRKELPPGLIFKAVNDESEDICKSLRQLYLLVGIILLVIFILIFLILRNIKPSLFILSSIAFSVLITFNLIYIFKISINLLTLGGLALGFGLFVDNSIVVFENVVRLREKGLFPVKAAIQGSKEVFLPVLASTLTTISVFFSFAYFQGRLKIYYLPLAIVISSALVASLLVSFSLIPAITPKLMRKEREKPREKFQVFYEKILKFLLRHPVEVILIMIFIFYGSYRWFKEEVTIEEFFRWYFRERLMVRIIMPPGTEIERTDAVIKKFEERVLEKNYEKEMNVNIFPEAAYLDITFPPYIENSYRPYILKEELIQLAANFAGIGVYIGGFDPQPYYSSLGTGTRYDSRIRFFGYNLKKIKEITAELEQLLKRNSRIKEVRIVSSRFGYWRHDSYEYILNLDKEALQKYDIDPDYLFYHLQSSIRGKLDWMKSKVGGKEIVLSLKFDQADEMDLKNLEDVLFETRGGEHFRLGEISNLVERSIAGSIDRENQQFQQTVMWEFRGPYKEAERYKKAVFSSIQLPPGFSATLEEEWRLTEQEKAQITFAIVLSLIIIFMILASLYESLIHPFFILLAVPLALIGVFIAFVIADFPFDSSAYIGVILLGGIVVNNSILLVDHINLKRKQGLFLLGAVLKGARERIRPIFLTTGTTVLGMLPMVLIQVEEGRKGIWRSLALSTVGGLMSSTIFILVAIPVLYFHGEKIRLWTYVKIEELRKAWKNFH
jgi:HAE1 family hydrophobic/amphiphilic exporter-1